MKTKRDEFVVYFLVILKNIIYGSSILFTANLLNTVGVLDVLSIRFLLSSVVLLLMIAFKIIKVNFKKKHILFLFLAALFEPVLEFIFETLGIMYSSSITVAIISACIPIASCIVQYIILKEKTNITQTICMLFGIAGVIYIVVNTDTASGNDTPIGIIFMFLAVISGALYGAFSRKTSKGGEFSSWDVTCFASFAGAIAFNGANIVKRLSDGTITEYFKPLENVDNIIGFIFLAVFCTVIGTGMNNIALAKIEPLRITAFSGVCTIVTIVEGVLIGGEKLELFHIIGTVLIIASVFGVNYFAVRHIKIIDDFKHYIKERKSSSK